MWHMHHNYCVKSPGDIYTIFVLFNHTLFNKRYNETCLCFSNLTAFRNSKTLKSGGHSGFRRNTWLVYMYMLTSKILVLF